MANIKPKRQHVDTELLNMHQYKITSSCPEDVWKSHVQLGSSKRRLSDLPEEISDKDKVGS